ncbi:MAG TPA: MMPL family transporter, partial [Thermoleophilaceae bacterium]
MFFGRIARGVARRPLLVLAVVAALALGGAALALRLEPSAATSTLVDRSSDSFKATERFKQDFGDDAVLVLVQGKLSQTVLSDDLGRLLGLEGCLGGNGSPKALRRLLRQNRKDPSTGFPPACEQLAKLKPAKAVYGPGTFINTAVNQIQDELRRQVAGSAQQQRRAAAAARKASAQRGDSPEEQERLAKAASDAVQAQTTQGFLRTALRYGLTSVPSLDNASFISSLVFTSRPGVPKSRFAYLFPSKNAALIQVRLRPNLSDAEKRRAIDLIEQATGARAFAPQHGASYVVTGVPVVANALADAVQSAIFVLLGAALVLMAGTLALVFRSRLRLLPLGLALAAAALTFGALSLAGGTLTMASIAVLPVLLGLGVDYAIQYQARVVEEGDPVRAARVAVPVIAT